MSIEYSEEKPELESELAADLENITEENDGVVTDDPEILDLKEIETLEEKAKAKKKIRDQLEVRRAIEDHFAEKRLREEIDYLIDDDFLEDKKSNDAPKKIKEEEESQEEDIDEDIK